MQSLVFDDFGSADVLYLRDSATPSPGDGEILVEVSAAGLNFADVYRRQGRYPLAGEAPWTAGYEGAGRVVQVGAGVSDWQPGDRIGFTDVPLPMPATLSSRTLTRFVCRTGSPVRRPPPCCCKG